MKSTTVGHRAGMTEAALRRYREIGARSHLPFSVRLERYCLIRSMRDGIAPFDTPMSLQGIADRLEALGYERMSRERVRQLLLAPPVERRPRAAERAKPTRPSLSALPRHE